MVKKFNTLFSFVHSVVRSLHMGSEPQDASHAQSGLHSRLSSQLKACSAAALLAVGGLADADAAVVHWQNANLLIPNTLDGLYINVETQATGSAGNVTAGWDINPYTSTAFGLTWWNATGTGMMRFPGVTSGSAGNLAQGTEINATRSYGSGPVVVGSGPGKWQLNASNYFGFRFVASDGLTHYGWGRFVIGASISGTDRMIAELAYESVAGTAITIPDPSAISGAPVGGTVVYGNSASSPMRNAVVVLKQGNAEVVRDTTDATGAFLLPLVAPGTYDVVVTSNTPWGGVNATDAVLILRSFSGSAPLNGIRLTAADVNGSASVNSTDALNALNRFTGALLTFSVGNYAASTSSYTASGAGTGSLNVSMLCYGDVNASYQPNGGFVRTSWKDLSTQGVARITSGSYEVPFFVSRGVQPAGVSLELELPEGLRVLGVRASEGLRANQVVYHQEGNRVRMAWLDESGAELKAGDVLCYVQVEGAVEGVWRSSTEVELANVLGEVQSGVELRMPKLSASLGAMEASVYPNPGRGLRTLSLELSEGMGVAVRVTDALGRTVYTHTAGTLASGTHLMELNMEGWPVGSYQVQVLGATAESKTHQRSITVLQTR